MSEITSEKKLLTEQRHRRILEIVQAKGIANVDELTADLGVSSMTIWRDLSALDLSGKVRRVRGGVASLEDSSSSEPLYVSKQIINVKKKLTIGRYAVENFINDNDIIIMEAGTTVGSMIKFMEHRNLTVITNGLGNLETLSHYVPDMTVLSCGGMLRDVAYTFVGPQAEDYFRSVHASTIFLSATGLVHPQGITDPNLLEIQIKRAMVASARRAILLIDSTKFGVSSLSPIVPLESFQVLVTDQEAPEADLDLIREKGIEVHIAK